MTCDMSTTSLRAPSARAAWIASLIWRSPAPMVIFPFSSMIVTSPTLRMLAFLFMASLPSRLRAC